MLSINQLSKSYSLKRQELILDQVSLQVESGEFLCLVGPSGSGKTTLLKCVAGLESYEEGSIALNHKKLESHLFEFAVVFQESLLLPWCTVRRNILLPLELKKVSEKKQQKKVEELLRLTKLTGFAEHRPNEISGGMKQLVAIARALATEAPILLLDEPFAALDAVSRERLNAELWQIAKQTKKTVLLVTHSIDEAVALGDRVLVMTPRPAKVFRSFSLHQERKQVIQSEEPTLDAFHTWRNSGAFFQSTREIRRSLELAMHQWLSAKVMPGEGRGRLLGFPTLNLDLPSLPFAHGVYAAKVRLPKQEWWTEDEKNKMQEQTKGIFEELPAVVHYGPKSTFGGTEDWVEVHILDFDLSRRIHELHICFLDFIRPTAKFPDPESLIQQMSKDCGQARAAVVG